jgi:hypothetical protein
MSSPIANSSRSSWKTAGERRHQAVLQHPTYVTNSVGGRTISGYTAYDSDYWVSVTPVPVFVDETNATVQFVIEGVYRTDVLSQDHVVANGQTYKVIEMVNPGEMNRSLQLLCLRAANT